MSAVKAMLRRGAYMRTVGWLIPAILLLSFSIPCPATIDQAEQALAAAQYQAAIEYSEKLLDEQTPPLPGTVRSRAHRVLGFALESTGRYREALLHLAQVNGVRPLTAVATQADGRSPDGNVQTDIEAELASAQIELLLDNRQSATDRMNEIVATYRKHAKGLNANELIAVAKAYVFFARGDPSLYPMGLARLEEAIALAPTDPATHVAMGELLLDRYNNSEAATAFQAALELDPMHPRALLGMARSQRFDHSPQAETTARRILEINPSFMPARLLLSELLTESEQYDEAIREIDLVLQHNPNAPRAQALAAAIDYLRDRFSQFDERMAAINRSTPGYLEVYEILAETASHNRRYADAVLFATSAVSKNPDAGKARQLLGLNQLRIGKMDEGRQSLEAAFSGDPYNVLTKNTLELLDQLKRFQSHRSQHFELVATVQEAGILAPLLLPIAEQAYDFYRQRYGIRPPTPIRIEVYPSHEDFSVRTIGLVGVDILGVSFGPVIALDSPSAGKFGPFNWASVLWHEIAHSFHMALTRSRVPRWFSEGLAVFEEHRARPGWGTDVSPTFLQAFNKGMLAPASDLNQAFLRPTYPEQVPHAYFQAALLMDMVEQTQGFEAILRMLNAYADGKQNAQVLQDELDMSASALNEAFDSFVRERYGESLAGLTGEAQQTSQSPTNVAAEDLDALDEGVKGQDDAVAAMGYQQLLEHAEAALKAKQIERALMFAEQAWLRFPAHGGPGSAYRLLARIHVAADRPELAISALQRSIAIDADDIEAHQELAALYERQQSPADAQDVLERALLIQPFDGSLHEQLALLYETAGTWQEAAAARRAVVALNPLDAAGARYRLARALHRDGQFEPARLTLLDALEAAPMYDEALTLLLEIVQPPNETPNSDNVVPPETDRDRLETDIDIGRAQQSPSEPQTQSR